MASDPQFVRFVCEQLRGAGEIASRRMFGEAAIYLDEKVVGLVCDNQLFIKNTDAGRVLIGTPTEAAPFPGASLWFLLADLDDPEFLAELVRTTAAVLPPPKIKKKKLPEVKKKSTTSKKNPLAKPSARKR